jgi:hypothetical protein
VKLVIELLTTDIYSTEYLRIYCIYSESKCSHACAVR